MAEMETEMEVGVEEREKHSVLRGRYELGRVLGQGTFARVYHARNVRTGKSVAMKVVAKEKVTKAGMMEQMKREISIMKKVKHPNIVELYEVMASKSRIYLAMELVKGGELFAKVAKGGKLGEDLAREYFRQLISAVDFCHSRGVYHRDLKLENLLVDEVGNLKITDFGLSTSSSSWDTQEEKDRVLHTRCGTPAYVAPEVVSRKGEGYQGSKADIWSCGVILYALLAGYLPFHDDNLIEMYRKIYKANFKYPSWVSQEARKLITRMLDPKPSTRITVTEIMESKWYNMDPSKGRRDSDLDVFEKMMYKKETEMETLNAFHIISLSEGFDLSPLFEERREERENMRFATTRSASAVISRLEEVAARAGKFEVEKAGEAMVRLQRQERGRKGRLAIAAEIFPVSPAVLMVEVKKDSGDTFEYNQFCSQELRPALKDIVWTSTEIQP